MDLYATCVGFSTGESEKRVKGSIKEEEREKRRKGKRSGV
jgi:hypothetical protein